MSSTGLTTTTDDDTSTSTSTSTSETFQICVMTYNIQQLHDWFGPATWWDQANRAAHLPAALHSLLQQKENNVDVLIFNEAFNAYAAKIALELRDIFPHQTPVLGQSAAAPEMWTSSSTTGTLKTAAINGGVMILSRYPIVEQRQYIFAASHPRTWDSYSNKGVVYVKLQIADEMVHVLGTHLQADEGPVPHLETHAVRMEQVREIRHFLQHHLQLAREEEKVIVGGDFNVEYTNQTFRTELEANFNTRIHNYYDQHKVPGSFSCTHNSMTRANARANGNDEERNETLDYILVPNDYAPPINLPTIQVIPLKSTEPLYWRYLAKQWPEHKGLYHDLSDHYPVMATFQFSKSGAAKK